jgi:hypothetical protein
MLIDGERSPEAKSRLLSGRVNTVQCPNCGAPVTVASPLLYHDASKELLISYVPMELNLANDQQERIIGDLMRQLTSQLPPAEMKGYLFQPKRALTMQGLIDQILNADGVTPEMIEAQRARLQLIETMLQTPPEQIEAFIHEHDDRFDAQLFQTLTMMAQRIVEQGQMEIAEQLIALQHYLVQHSTFGRELAEKSRLQEQVVAEVAEAIKTLGQGAQRADFLQLALEYLDDDHRLQALVGLVRPAFDYQFFQELTARASGASEEERDSLDLLRDRLLELTALVDQQTQLAVQEAAGLLQAMMTSDDPDALIRDNAGAIDDTFMAVLSANLQEAERRADINASAKLKDIYNRVADVLRDQMNPELRFINELLAAPTDDEARSMLAEGVNEFGDALVEMMDAVEEVLAARGESAVLDRLALLREEAAHLLG